MQDLQQTTELLTVREVAHILRVHDSTVRRWIKDKNLSAIPLPSRLRSTKRVRKADIDALIAKPSG